MNTTLVSDLKAVRQLIADPKNWTKGAYARTASMYPLINVNSPAAESFCLVGAIRKVTGNTAGQLSTQVRREVVVVGALRRVLGSAGSAITRYNDRHQHSDVLALLDKAIAAEEAR